MQLSRTLRSGGGANPADGLSVAALQLALLFTAVHILMMLTHNPVEVLALQPSGEAIRTPFPMRSVAAYACIGGSLLVFLFARTRRIPAAAVIDLGLIYQVVMAMGISLTEHWEPWPVAYIPPTISWLCLWIALFPMVLPAPEGKQLLASIAAAFTGPLALLVAVAARGNPIPSGSVLAWLFIPTFFCVILAAYPSGMIHRLERAIEKARELGAYLLVEQIGRGGMGEVWLAEHRLLARPAALKLIRSDAMAGGKAEERESLQARFRQEAEAIAALRSPHTVELYDFGLTDDGSFYFVMELLEGMDLDTLVAKHGKQPAGRVVHFLRQACHSLREAHSSGLVHRDVKPANLIACHYGLERDFLKVLDFGLVRPTKSPEGQDRLTQEGRVAGTPAFMAPELVEAPDRVDGRSDLYSLGCVAYWLLAGRSVFEAASGPAMMIEHARTPPLTLTKREVEIPEALETLIMACLEKDPADRPPTAAALDERLAATGLTWSQEEAKAWWAERDPPT